MEGDAIRMSVPLNGVTTQNGRNPRTELSEMYHWNLVKGVHRLKATVNIQKFIKGVNFDIGQILRDDRKIKFKSGKGCPVHVMLEYQARNNKIYAKSRTAECKNKRTKLRTRFYPGEEFSYELAVIDGIMTFQTQKTGSKKTEKVVIDDFNFLSHEYEARGEKGYFKAGVYTQKSCKWPKKFKDVSKCEVGGEGPNAKTVVDFKNISITHEKE